MIEQNAVFQIRTEEEFNRIAIKIFNLQAKNNVIYAEYIRHLKITPSAIQHYTQIPFLPVSFFKTQKITSQTNTESALIFSSSGTTQQQTSQHYVADISWYEQSYQNTFKRFYGSIDDYCILALLPSYLERKGSSLVYMVEDLIRQSQHQDSGFFLHNHQELAHILTKLKAQKQKTLLIGVSFALIDFVEDFEIIFPELIVMETGGMKGKRKELIREELHQILCKGFGVKKIHAEYGMTELLSQAYSSGDGIFETPNYMKILIRDPNDPFHLQENGKSGGINIIDLANLNSCSFIATQDLGRLHSNGKFEILGRFDHSDIRGCNLLVQ